MNRTLLMLLSVTLFATAFGTYLVLSSAIRASIAELGTALEHTATADTRVASARNARSLLLETADERTALAAFVIRESDVAGAIETIESAGRTANVAVSVSTAEEEAQAWKYHAVVTLKLSARGSFKNLGTFTAILESLPFASRLEKVSFEESEENVWYAAFTLSFIKEKQL